MLKRLTDKQLEQLHVASLDVMEKSGVRLLETDAVEVLKKAGCQVNDGFLVRFPPKLVEWALETAPKEILIYNQKGEQCINLSGRCSYYGNGSDLLFIIDHKTGERRKPVLQDVKDIVAVIEAMPDFDFVMSGFIPTDVPRDQAQKYQMQTMLEYTKKPIVYVTTSLENTQMKIAMAEIVAGSPEVLRQRPFAINYINISNPLRHNPDSIEKLMWLSEKGLPFVYRPAIITRGISTPVTWAGFLVVNNVAALAGVVLSQLVREGAPFIRCGCSGGTFDMKTMVGQHSASEIRGFNEDMCEYYKLPRFGIGGLCGAKDVDQQAAYESALTLITAAQSGAQLIHDVGYMDNGTTGSLEQLVICHEIIGWVKQYMKNIEINDETIALDIIDEVVRQNGDFLSTDHTMRHFKEDYYPELTDRGNYDTWLKNDALTLRQKAKKKVEQILSEHHQPILPDKVLDELRRFVARVI